MVEWKRLGKRIPSGRLLLYGKTSHANPSGVSIKKEVIFTGYYDEIDRSWCADGSHWDGPFFDVTHYAEIPEGPSKHAVERKEEPDFDDPV
jgi:hypothetical protein